MNRPPPPGVSTIDESGANRPVKEAAVAKRGRETNAARQRAAGRDPISEKGRVVDPVSPASDLLKSKQQVVEIPIGRARSKRHSASFQSVDGERYSFATHDDRGRAFAFRENLAIFLALREIGCGGSPFPVLDAFKVSLEDADGKKLYPVPGLTHAEPPEEAKGYTLGDADT
jgi:hypothetical protein